MIINVSVNNAELFSTYREFKAAVNAEAEKELISYLLTRFAGNITLASRTMKMDRKHLSDLCKKHSINPDHYRSRIVNENNKKRWLFPNGSKSA